MVREPDKDVMLVVADGLFSPLGSVDKVKFRRGRVILVEQMFASDRCR
jgi:hypothetical protein